jgi:hydroxymethylpyrimidine pyrophosphatase-like HAD family hydrolase
MIEYAGLGVWVDNVDTFEIKLMLFASNNNHGVAEVIEDLL